MSDIEKTPAFEGNDRLLLGLILSVLTFWLFAQTMLNVAPVMGKELGADSSMMNIAVSSAALFSGIFTVVMGGLADRIGRMRIMVLGLWCSMIGSLVIALAPVGALSMPVLLLGRVLQGFSAACIMPASLALVKTYWDGAARQRAVSLWSIGTWGGSSLCSLFGGLVAQNWGWRWIFFASVAVAALGLFLIRGAPESKAEPVDGYKFDWAGVLTFMVAVVALQVGVTQGAKFGWTSPLLLVLGAVTAIFGTAFVWAESKAKNAFLDFKLFRNPTYAGATLSNFLLNGVAGTLFVSLQLVQRGGTMTAQQAGSLTLGYAIAVISFIRVGEKLLQRFGSRRPMIWGSLITGTAILLLSPAHLLQEQYRIFAMVGYALFGMGLAFYATPSTDAALSSLPAEQAGAGAGIYKMASSLGASFGVAISATVFTSLSADNSRVRWLEGVLGFVGRQDNLAIREAAMVALMFNVLIIAMVIASIMLTVPKQKRGSQ